MPAAELRQLWQRLFRNMPAAGLSHDLLVRSLAYLVQADRNSDLSPLLRRRLHQAALEAVAAEEPAGQGDKKSGAPAPNVTRSRVMRPGSRMVREWRGQVHEVIVVPDGFLWDGQVFGSLSTIARRITGTSWNGWVFFGVWRTEGRRRQRKDELAPQRDALTPVAALDAVSAREVRA